ncbi:uncharacterized protein [Symphalangus syndactylus]|uniref:uncharacterized protein n=1 Tax=Symphalangus syndactylus TaxID=9590 RepID=UPI003004119F
MYKMLSTVLANRKQYKVSIVLISKSAFTECILNERVVCSSASVRYLLPVPFLPHNRSSFTPQLSHSLTLSVNTFLLNEMHFSLFLKKKKHNSARPLTLPKLPSSARPFLSIWLPCLSVAREPGRQPVDLHAPLPALVPHTTPPSTQSGRSAARSRPPGVLYGSLRPRGPSFGLSEPRHRPCPPWRHSSTSTPGALARDSLSSTTGREGARTLNPVPRRAKPPGPEMPNLNFRRALQLTNQLNSTFRGSALGG